MDRYRGVENCSTIWPNGSCAERFPEIEGGRNLLLLRKEDLWKIKYFMQDYGRDLERKLFSYLYEEDPCDKVIEELSRYQNEDGGFGNALEPDFRLPHSSPMATSVAFQIIVKLDCDSAPKREMISRAMAYLEKTFIPERMGWLSVPESVNDFPHAPWWHFDSERGMSPIDINWGNPTAEIIGYLHRYREYTSLDVDALIENAIEYLNGMKEFVSFHEIFCFERLHSQLDTERAKRLENKIVQAVSNLTCCDEDEWKSEYTARPLDFATGPDRTFGIDGALIEKNLDFYVQALQSNGRIKPAWSKNIYNGDLAPAWDEWSAILTLRALETLRNFGRVVL